MISVTRPTCKDMKYCYLMWVSGKRAIDRVWSICVCIARKTVLWPQFNIYRMPMGASVGRFIYSTHWFFTRFLFILVVLPTYNVILYSPYCIDDPSKTKYLYYIRYFVSVWWLKITVDKCKWPVQSLDAIQPSSDVFLLKSFWIWDLYTQRGNIRDCSIHV